MDIAVTDQMSNLIKLEKYVTSLVAVLRSYTKFIPGTLGGTYKRFHPRALPLNEKKAFL
jgi:hypothetical protein